MSTPADDGLHVQSDCFNENDCDNCYGCHLSVCSVCHAYEGSLTTECPGEQVDCDRQELVYKEGWDYTRELGWHKRTDIDPDNYFVTPKFASKER